MSSLDLREWRRRLFHEWEFDGMLRDCIYGAVGVGEIDNLVRHFTLCGAIRRERYQTQHRTWGWGIRVLNPEPLLSWEAAMRLGADWRPWA